MAKSPYHDRWQRVLEEINELTLLEHREDAKHVTIESMSGRKRLLEIASTLRDQEARETPLLHWPKTESAREEGYVIWRYGGKRATLLPSQAAVLDVLVAAHEKGIPDVTADVLITASGRKVIRLVEVFARSEAWEWIKSTRTGHYAWAE